MIIPHIIIALSTIGFSGLSLLKPTKTKLYTSYFLTIATFITGGYLVLMSPSNIVSACITGLIFLGLVGVILFAANKRIAKP